jgi:hypothetical protein
VKLRALAPIGMLVVTCMLGTPVHADPRVALPETPPLHYWAAASVDQATPPDRATALSQLRDLYRQESLILDTFTNVNGIRLYGPDETGKLWTVHGAISRREILLNLPESSWGLPVGTFAVTPIDYPSITVAQKILSASKVPFSNVQGLPIFLAPMYIADREGTTIRNEAPWLDTAILLYAGAHPDVILHEIGHVVSRHVLGESAMRDQYLAHRSQGKPLTGNAWADSLEENFAEDFRVTMGGDAYHLGQWGLPGSNAQAELSRLLTDPGQRPGWLAFSLSDGLGQRTHQPLTGFTFATDQSTVTLSAPGMTDSVRLTLCQQTVCWDKTGRLPMLFPLPSVGVYHLTVQSVAGTWVEAILSRVEARLSPHSSIRTQFCDERMVVGQTASEAIHAMAMHEGWGDLPLPILPSILGHGWDQDPHAKDLAWARLTGIVSPIFAWQHSPTDLLLRSELLRYGKPPEACLWRFSIVWRIYVSRPATAA